ncbi:MAG: hypothetical protein IPL99_15045 [Candidatus Competibacteraceae bacterium]|nr:hypothetical protein [Candidatus Competibacteraceae bacterium]
MNETQKIAVLEEQVKELAEKLERLASAISRYGFSAPEIINPSISIIDRISNLESSSKK